MKTMKKESFLSIRIRVKRVWKRCTTEHLKKEMKTMMKNKVTKEKLMKNQVWTNISIFISHSPFDLDEDEDFSDGDLSADPVEGQQTSLHSSLSLYLSLSLRLVPKGEKRKNNDEEEDGEGEGEGEEGPPRKI